MDFDKHLPALPRDTAALCVALAWLRDALHAAQGEATRFTHLPGTCSDPLFTVTARLVDHLAGLQQTLTAELPPLVEQLGAILNHQQENDNGI